MNRQEAKRHWFRQVEVWSACSRQLADEILALDGRYLQFAVASVADAIASEGGAVAIKRVNPTTVSVVGLYIDEEVEAAILARMAHNECPDPLAVLREADIWLRDRLLRTTILQVAWSFGRLQNVLLNPEDQFKTLEQGNVIYDVKRNRFVGVRYDDGIWKAP